VFAAPLAPRLALGVKIVAVALIVIEVVLTGLALAKAGFHSPMLRDRQDPMP
jgi:hypothetical protein